VLRSLTTGLHVGRSNIKQVAEKRYQEVSAFVTSLFKCADEIAHSDLVYTFFHPLLRDQYSTEEVTRRSKGKQDRAATLASLPPHLSRQKSLLEE
jgi:phosphatidylinositol-4-phosphate 3-kinase